MSAKPLFMSGIPVATAPKVIPSNATNVPLFTVSGVVIVNALIGVVTTALTGTSASVQISVSQFLSGTIAAAPVGSMIVNGVQTQAVQVFASVGARYQGYNMQPVILANVNNTPSSNANLFLQWLSGGPISGQVQWYAWYWPVIKESGMSAV